MTIVIAPAHVNLDYERYGSESLSVYLLLKHLHLLGVDYLAIIGEKPSYVYLPKGKVIEVGTKGDLISFHIDVNLQLFRLLKNMRNKQHVVLHHMLPFSFHHGVNLCIAFRCASRISGAVVGPITYPAIHPYIDEAIAADLKPSILTQSLVLSQNPLLGLLHKLTLRNTDTILFDSRKTLNLFKNIYGGLAEYQVLYLPIDVDSIPFKPTTLENKGSIVVASIGGLRFVKRHDLFLMLVKYLRIQERMDVKGYIIGWGPLRSHLSKLIEKLGLKGVVELMSFKRRDMIKFVAENVDIVVLFSMSEGVLPTAIREAMAMGKIVLMRNVGAADEFIVNGVNGFIFNDLWEAVDIIKKLNAREARRIAISARRTVEKFFSPTANAKRLVRIYEKVNPRALE